jgi:hypothetical protein
VVDRFDATAMNMEADRSPVTDPDSPSEQIYRILVGEVCKSCVQESLGAMGVASAGIRPVPTAVARAR